jgi:hypothetical protein
MQGMNSDNLIQMARFKSMPPHPAYIAGLIDGDGCIFIRKIANGYQSGITITQCRSNVLQVIRYHFGGSITTSINRNNKVEDVLDDTGEFYHKHNRRNQYNLMLRSNEYKLLLDYIRHEFIIKQPQIECLYEFYKLADIPNVIEAKEALYQQCKTYNENKIMDESYLVRMSNEYIQGLFDAEGCLYIHKIKINKFYISISQKNHPIVLEKIKKFLGYGNVYRDEYVIYNKTDCLKFIALVKSGLIVKYNQAIAFETYLTTDSIDIKKAMYKICNEEKHKIECFDKTNCNDTGKEAFNETMRLRTIKDAVCRELHRKEVYKEKSEQMKGAGNHNFGKPKSDETKKKMSIGIRDAKNGVSDETILKVRELINAGKKNMEIEAILSLARHIVSNIKTGKLVCRTEEREERPDLSQEEINIRRRKITLPEMLIVVDKSVAGEKPGKILELLDAQRLKDGRKNDLTPDIIKNIKRNLQQNKLPFYKSELDPEKYHYYETLIKGFSEKHIKTAPTIL